MVLTIQTTLNEGMKFLIWEAVNFDYFVRFVQEMSFAISVNVVNKYVLKISFFYLRFIKMAVITSLVLSNIFVMDF